MRETETSAPSLGELSEAATQGAWTYPDWGTDFRTGKTLIGMTSPAFEGNGRANRAFIVALVNAFRAGRLIDQTAMAEAVASARAESWQPIETAPKDGTSFLACHAGSGVHQITWHGKASHIPLYGWAHGEDVEDVDLWSPTHWMPLPAPPTLIPGGSSDV